MKLGVNIDHIATIRQTRGTSYPSIVDAVKIAESSGADSITLHLREDRRHMQDQDLFDLKPIIQTKMNLEMAATEEMLKIALEIMPEDVCIVPERREERTTEGGLDLKNYYPQIKTIVHELADHDIRVSLFIAPDREAIDLAIKMQVPVIELHTGHYADTHGKPQQLELEKITRMAEYAAQHHLVVNAGHGLNYTNVSAMTAVKHIDELNIGHAIVAEALFIGWDNAIKKMKSLIGT
jgi:pyridoxine 5-phosphate synthase